MLTAKKITRTIEAATKTEGIGRAKFRLGATIWRRKEFVSDGWCSYKTHPILKDLLIRTFMLKCMPLCVRLT